MTLEKLIVQECAPTLAGLKTGNLFTADCGTRENLLYEAEQCEAVLAPRGVQVFLMRVNAGRALVYVYRTALLERDLSCVKRREFLAECGYEDFSVEGAVERLAERIDAADGFPHEIGLFLGYPLRDVCGFVENCGQNCLMCGVWKVYHDVENAKKQFGLLRKCASVYKRVYHEGRTLERLTIPA